MDVIVFDRLRSKGGFWWRKALVLQYFNVMLLHSGDVRLRNAVGRKIRQNLAQHSCTAQSLAVNLLLLDDLLKISILIFVTKTWVGFFGYIQNGIIIPKRQVFFSGYLKETRDNHTERCTACMIAGKSHCFLLSCNSKSQTIAWSEQLLRPGYSLRLF